MGKAEELIAKFKTMDTTSLSDALDRLGIKGGCHGIIPMVPGVRIVGTAFTIRYRPCGVVKGDIGDFMDDASPGQVIMELLDKGMTLREARVKMGYHTLQSRQ